MLRNQIACLTLFIVFFTLSMVSCKDKDKDEPMPDPTPGSPSYTVPATYNFSGADYSGQTTRIKMLDEIRTEMDKWKTGATVDAAKLKEMFANQNNRFTDAALNSSGKQLKDKTFIPDQPLFEQFFDSVAKASEFTGTTAAKGVRGVAVSTGDNTKKYLLSANGFEYIQMLQKGLMSATFYYQAVAQYLSDEKTGDNIAKADMEHHWDEAFGYFGVPVDFPGNTTGVKYWGSYSNQVNPAIGSNAKMMNAFLTGRAAISNNDLVTKNQQRAVLLQEWERIVAASAIHELNAAKGAISDPALVSHYVSEAYGFILGLKYHPNKKISNDQHAQLLNTFGDSLYDITLTDINTIINTLSAIYDFDSVKGTI